MAKLSAGCTALRLRTSITDSNVLFLLLFRQIKWMMYWIVFALFTCVETFTDIFFSFWFPFYYEIKIILVVYLLSPATKGSSMLYRRFVHPALSKREQVSSKRFLVIGLTFVANHRHSIRSVPHLLSLIKIMAVIQFDFFFATSSSDHYKFITSQHPFCSKSMSLPLGFTKEH
jgi:hypothetical protein